MSEQSVNVDLAKERLNATFDVENLTNLIYGGPEKVERRRQIHKVASEDPFYKKLKPWSYCSVEEQYENGLAKHNHIKESIDKLELNGFDDLYYYKSCVTPHEPGPLDVHYGMFIPTIEQQGTAEQKEKWLAPAYEEEIKGTYAQTEMGHGTFLRGLETTATYDPKTKEFILNSPTLTSIKYWPAALGKTTNHCVVVAQLFTQGTCHGIHTFMLQTRSLEDHSVLPGIEVGVIGNKFGFGTNDNGYLKLTNVRIPKDNMLMRYSKVLEDGTYIKPKNSKVSYGVMVYVRSMIVKQAFNALAEACVISIRYSAVRRQSETVPGGIEPQILDYQTQQYRLFPLLATAYALYFAGNYMSTAYSEGSQKIEKGQLEELPQLHALSAGLKAFTSYAASSGVEVCRICCGGHGYSHASGLPKIYVSVVPACTYEGENTVMMLQVARLIEAAAKQMQSLIQSGSPAHEAWNKSSVQLLWAANAHCHLFCVKNFVENIESSSGDSRTNEVLKAVCQLYSIHGILENLGEFIHDGFLSGQQVDYLQKAMFKLFEVIRPNAVALVDAFDIPDQVLQSCLGRYDGQVYQALYDYARMAPMNQTEIHSTYYTHLRPLMNPQASTYSKL
ncbi:peroxisomal acyl-coenzyme A oxidase 1-like isoform X2 [Mytilus californianus]|uniref:peroxisomal acyl-coenzyme A oxidase 1-like isoform X2 n=1 Tax=Mytilus californianus TaxID=6549 RepID=UPI002246AFCD|nr:peroxisomal acyl-coenzyme A oxidase 1-like isoform X2 [Mytilus californianus]